MPVVRREVGPGRHGGAVRRREPHLDVADDTRIDGRSIESEAFEIVGLGEGGAAQEAGQHGRVIQGMDLHGFSRSGSASQDGRALVFPNCRGSPRMKPAAQEKTRFEAAERVRAGAKSSG